MCSWRARKAESTLLSSDRIQMVEQRLAQQRGISTESQSDTHRTVLDDARLLWLAVAGSPPLHEVNFTQLKHVESIEHVHVRTNVSKHSALHRKR